jgi:hypothetical protein
MICIRCGYPWTATLCPTRDCMRGTAGTHTCSDRRMLITLKRSGIFNCGHLAIYHCTCRLSMDNTNKKSQLSLFIVVVVLDTLFAPKPNLPLCSPPCLFSDLCICGGTRQSGPYGARPVSKACSSAHNLNRRIATECTRNSTLTRKSIALAILQMFQAEENKKGLRFYTRAFQ